MTPTASATEATAPLVGLALGSGGARGLAHIGVVEVLEEQGIPIGLLAGSSIGAVIGALYATGRRGEELRRIAFDATWRRAITLLDPSVRHGPLRGTKVEQLVQQWVGGTRVEDCTIPLAVVATDLRSGQPVVFREGDLAGVVRASIAVPGVFRLAEYDARLLADAGLSVPVPAEPVREMGADVVVAIDLDWERPFSEPSLERDPGARQIANTSIELLRRHLAAMDARYADVVVRPSLGREIHWDKFLAPKDIIQSGRDATTAAIPALRNAIQRARRRRRRHRSDLAGAP